MSKILEIKDLSVHFPAENGTIAAVNGISFDLQRGETVGIVGESGSGKSVTSLSIMRLLSNVKSTAGQILFYPTEGKPIDLMQLPNRAMQQYRGAEIAMIFQEPMTSLNPVFRCGHQVTEAIQLHQQIPFSAAKAITLNLFEKVKLPEPARIFDAYPHQLSGGQKQRVMIAMAMSCQPSILIADEPTTALDVTVQKTILDLMRELKDETAMSMLFISHDLGVISEIADRVVVMYKGKIVEQGPVQEIFQHPQHPYTQGLIACRPSLKRKVHFLPTVQDFIEKQHFEAKEVTAQETAERRNVLYKQQPVLTVENLIVRYPKEKNFLGQTKTWTQAVNDVSFEVFPSESFGLVGESGCGKTTLGRAIGRLTDTYSGTVHYQQKPILNMSDEEMQAIRRDIQIVFQDPYASLNPRMTIGAAVLEPMQVHKLHANDAVRREKTIELLETVGISADKMSRYPHEFSGGQRQRICIARALALEPKFLICDEIVSALDVSVQATVLNLLTELREKFGLTYLFISHDLSVVKQLCDRIMVMNQGKVEEIGFPEDIYGNPKTDYVRTLINAIPGK